MPIYFIAILAAIKLSVKPNPWPEINSFPSYKLTNVTLSPSRGDHILVSPDDSFTRAVMSKTKTILETELSHLNVNFTVDYFATSEAATKSYQSGANKVFAGVVFNNASTTQYSYTIRLPFDDVVKTTDNPYRDQSQCRSGDPLDSFSCDVNKYLHSGFSVLQSAIDAAFIALSLNKTQYFAPNISFQMMPKPGFVPDTSYIQIISSLYFIIAYSPFVNFLVVNLVAEKEKKIKEGMKMMGLRDTAFWLV